MKVFLCLSNSSKIVIIWLLLPLNATVNCCLHGNAFLRIFDINLLHNKYCCACKCFSNLCVTFYIKTHRDSVSRKMPLLLVCLFLVSICFMNQMIRQAAGRRTAGWTPPPIVVSQPKPPGRRWTYVLSWPLTPNRRRGSTPACVCVRNQKREDLLEGGRGA